MKVKCMVKAEGEAFTYLPCIYIAIVKMHLYYYHCSLYPPSHWARAAAATPIK